MVFKWWLLLLLLSHVKSCAHPSARLSWFLFIYLFVYLLLSLSVSQLPCISTYHVQRSCPSMHVTDVLCPGVCCFIHENTLVVSVHGGIEPYGYGWRGICIVIIIGSHALCMRGFAEMHAECVAFSFCCKCVAARNYDFQLLHICAGHLPLLFIP